MLVKVIKLKKIFIVNGCKNWKIADCLMNWFKLIFLKLILIKNEFYKIKNWFINLFWID